MPTFTQEVTVSANDGWGSSAGGGSFQSTGATYLGKSDLDGSGDTGELTWCWWRFTNVTIPKNSTVSAAYLELTASSNAQRTHNLAVRVGPEAADNPAAPTTGPDLFARTLTNYVEWNLPATSPNGEYQTPSLATPLTSHFARSGWASGNAIQLLATYLSGDLTAGSGGAFGVEMDTANTAGAGEFPFVSITYTAPAAAPLPHRRRTRFFRQGAR